MCLFFQQRILCNYLTNATFQITLSKNWQGPVTSELGKEGPKELLHEQVSVFDLIIFKLMVKLSDPAMRHITYDS